ncbi:serine/threonine protein phosphatase [Longimycelium tulufanense]|uniref:Serine/threonine protein phosphatase n=1 Tax=Longimycelium tulufanense TaxID=907463 RepID=A0A8J3CBP7_9PSEU|nr:serine/threonine protein phosphatase [Longimycelium tulufanense]
MVGDVHGHLEPLVAALTTAGLVDAAGDWAGADAGLWFLGDFTDRGPDGIGVIDLVMRLARQADEAGGHVGAVLGNHELLLLGAHHFPDEPVSPNPRTYRELWQLNGGRTEDLTRLRDEHVAWLSGLPAAAVVADHLLVHSDTTAYLELGSSVTEVNRTVARVIAEPRPEEWTDCMRLLFRRGEFLDPTLGPKAAEVVLRTLGGRRIVHGHSPIPVIRGIDPWEVEGPYVYADGRVVDVDAGLFFGGPCLVVPLPLPESGDEEPA